MRTLQRWFVDQHLTKPRQQLQQPPIGQAKAVHNIRSGGPVASGR
ncbi:hypothetical protein [Runella sp.]|nr:hypothetical protein [Runella sp.]